MEMYEHRPVTQHHRYTTVTDNESGGRLKVIIINLIILLLLFWYVNLKTLNSEELAVCKVSFIIIKSHFTCQCWAEFPSMMSHPSRWVCVKIKASFLSVLYSKPQPLLCCRTLAAVAEAYIVIRKHFRVSLVVRLCCHTLEHHSEGRWGNVYGNTVKYVHSDGKIYKIPQSAQNETVTFD